MHSHCSFQFFTCVLNYMPRQTESEWKTVVLPLGVLRLARVTEARVIDLFNREKTLRRLFLFWLRL
jgi:hypothetical protein